MSKKIAAKLIAATALLGSFAAAQSHVAQAAPPTNKVTICHRTHSVTNPYVRITVSQNSVGSGNGKHGGASHDQWSNVLFQSKPVPNVFNPAVTYTPSPQKKWGDIIAFTDTAGNALTGNAAQVAGLNNSGIGADIFNGTGQYAGLCRALNPRDYYEIEKANGQAPTDILNEMNEFEADEFSSALTACGGTFTGCNVSKLGTTSIVVTTTTTLAPAGTLPPGTTLTAGKGALQVTIWIDANRNGKKASAEKYLAGTTVKIVGPGGVTKTAKTNSSGVVIFVDLDPGTWRVAGTLSLSGYEKTYDSDGTPNWATSQSVVAGEVSSAAFATATKSSSGSTSSSSAGSETLAATGSRSSTGMALAAAALMGAGLVLVSRRRRTA